MEHDLRRNVVVAPDLFRLRYLKMDYITAFCAYLSIRSASERRD
jgi:hypothetical protein